MVKLCGFSKFIKHYINAIWIGYKDFGSDLMEMKRKEFGSNHYKMAFNVFVWAEVRYRTGGDEFYHSHWNKIWSESTVYSFMCLCGLSLDIITL